MKKLCLYLTLVFLWPMSLTAATSDTETAAEAVPAFPGAEGYARYTTTGGRGGTVYHVTNLNDSGTGSLRAGLTSSSSLIIVFDVSGYIDLKSDISVKSNKTVCGQTAPGDGITLRYYTVSFTNCDNVIVRYLRFRRSQIKDVNDGADAAWGRNHKNIIFDHCSFSWSIDELASFYDNRDFTMQWCTLGEALANPGHSKGEHSYGGIWGGKGASFHHNFLCHMQNRVPRFNGARYNWSGYDATQYLNTLDAERVDFRNCVMYNWGTGGCYGGPGGGYVNMINNYYKAGPGTTNKTRVTQCSVSDASNGGSNPFPGIASRYYIEGNYVTAAGASAKNYDWQGVIYDNGLTSLNGDRWIPDASHFYGDTVIYTNINGTDHVRLRLDEPFDAGEVTTHSAEVAFEKALLYAGASFSRDAIDARYMEEARTGTCEYTGTVTGRAGIIDLIQDPSATTINTALVAYPELTSESRPSGFDTDNDGMPDEWETANGLNPNSATDGKTYTLDERGWYTNVECYLNSIVEELIKAQNSDAIQSVDEYFPELASTAGISLADASSRDAILRVEYFTLSGQSIDEPCTGICIRRITWQDGTKSIDKVMKR